MKYVITVLAVLVFPLVAFAQSGRVVVRMDAPANSAMSASRSQGRVSGYRICIFSDNAQTGRAAAHTAVAQLRSIVGGVPAEVRYENPFFKAYAGYCLNRIEATRLLGRLRSAFPRAIIVGETFSISNLASSYQDEIIVDTVESVEIDADI